MWTCSRLRLSLSQMIKCAKDRGLDPVDIGNTRHFIEIDYGLRDESSLCRHVIYTHRHLLCSWPFINFCFVRFLDFVIDYGQTGYVLV
jgi:hypothetical protein